MLFRSTVPAEHRRALAVLLGLVAGALQLLAGGATWQEALTTAIGAPLLAISGPPPGVAPLRGGREAPLPGLMRPPGGPS